MKKVTIQFCLLIIPVVLTAQWVSNPSVNTEIQSNSDWCALPKVVSAENGDTYISWFTGVALNFNVYLQRLNAEGEKYWDDYGLLVSDNPTMTWVTDYDLKLDNQNNAIIANQDQRTGTNNAFAYKISPDGEFLWGEDGVNLSDTVAELCASPKAMVTNDNDVIFLWEQIPFDTVNNTVTIGMQKVSSDGIKQWGDGIFISDTLHHFMPTLVKTENNGFIVSWLARPNIQGVVPGQLIYMSVNAQKFDMDGNALWQDPVRIDTGHLLPYNGLYTYPKLIADEEGGAFICWKTFVGDDVSNYIHHIGSDGNLLWTSPTNVSTNINDAHSDGDWCYFPSTQEILIFWQEYHEDLMNAVDCFGVFGQKISSDGERMWGDEGKVFVELNCTMDTVYFNVAIAQSDENEVVVSYIKEFFEISGQDTSFNAEIHAMKINLDGGFIWGNEIIEVSTAFGSKSRVTVGNFSAGQWIAAWADTRNTLNEIEADIYAQNIKLDGSIGPLGMDYFRFDKVNNIRSFPNPFKGKTTLIIDLTENSVAGISLYDTEGRMLKDVYRGELITGENAINFDGSFLNQGVYFLKCEVGNYCSFHKIIVL